MINALLLRRTVLGCAMLLAVGAVHAQCHFIRADSQVTDTVTFSFYGGSFASYGCAPIDPTYWISGSGITATATFAVPEDHPTFRVWGMNDDDVASVEVNGVAYPLDATSAHYDPKVVCGQSPGPDGVEFVAGNVVGANDNIEGNYSYQDVVLDVNDVTSITITGIAGAGWGFAGVSVDCPASIQDISFGTQELFPNPTSGSVHLPAGISGRVDVTIVNSVGMVVRKLRAEGMLDLADLPSGVYTILIEQGQHRIAQRIMRN